MDNAVENASRSVSSNKPQNKKHCRAARCGGARLYCRKVGTLRPAGSAASEVPVLANGNFDLALQRSHHKLHDLGGRNYLFLRHYYLQGGTKIFWESVVLGG